MKTLYKKDDLGKSFGLAVCVMLVAQIILALAFGDTSDNTTAFWIEQVIYQLAIGATAFIYAAITKTKVVEATGMNKPPKVMHVIWGCFATLFLIALMLPINYWFIQLIVKLGFSEPSVDLPMQLVPMLLVSCLLPAFTEEVIFRGTISKSLEQTNNKLASLAMCGLLFSIFHLNPAQTVHQFVLGAFLALLVFRSGSLWTSSLVHMFNNIVAVILTFAVPDENVENALLSNYWYIFLSAGLVGFVGCVYGYLKTTKSHWNVIPEVAAEKTTSESKFFLIGAVVVCAFFWVYNLVMS